MTTTRQIEIFVKTAQLGSVRLAAESLGISQPAVSKQIKALERHTGGILFVREPGRSLSLSQLGRRILADAEQSLKMRHSIRDTVRDFGARVDMNIYVRRFLSSKIESRFQDLVAAGMDEDVTFVLVDDRDDIYARVQEDRNGISLLRSLNLKRSARLQTRVLRTEQASLYASAEVADRLEAGELGPRDLLYFTDDLQTETADFGQHMVRAAGLEDARPTKSPQFIERKMHRVLAGEAIGIFLDWHARSHVEAGKLKPLSPVQEQVHLMLMGHPLFDRADFDRLADIFGKVLLDRLAGDDGA